MASALGTHAGRRRPLPDRSRYPLRELPAPPRSRAVWQRTQTNGPQETEQLDAPTVLVVNFLDLVSAGWHNAGEALLANAGAARAREQRQAARDKLAA